MANRKFKVNDRVQVLSECDSTDLKGCVRKYINYPKETGRVYVQVKLDNGETHQYREESLKKIG